jgi:hypothetical protein
MKLLDTSSLAVTIDNLNEVFFYNRKLNKSEKAEVARWIASRQGLKGSYAGMFAPTELDFKNPLTVFTGEKITTNAGRSHIIGEEASRALLLLDAKDKNVADALDRASRSFADRISYPDRTCGMYCFGICTCSYRRHLNAGGLKNINGEAFNQRELIGFLQELKRHRDEKGRWHRFPFYYTLLVLEEIAHPSAIAEMRYTAPILERMLKRKADAGNKYAVRRHDLAERIMGKI